MRKFLTLSAQLAVFVTVASCSGDITSGIPMSTGAATNSLYGVSLASIVITPNTPLNMFVGTTAPLVAVVRDWSGAVVSLPVTWASLDTTIATVNAAGTVTARNVGSVIVTALSTEHLDSATVTIALVPVKSVTLVTPASLVVGQGGQATAQPRDSIGGALTGRTVTWSSRSPSIATVSASGLITAVSAGNAVIDVTCAGVTASATVVSVPVLLTVKTVTVSLSLASIVANTTSQATATLRDSLGGILTGTTTWSSSNTAVATVSSTGLVTALAAGSATISGTSSGKVGSAALTVTAVPVSKFTEVLAALPTTYLNTVAPVAPAAGGVVINVAAGGNLQAALNSAKPGDVVALANGATFTGNFTLPNKNTASTSWIIIRPQVTTALPAEGSRMTPTVAAKANLPMIRTTNGSGAIFTAASAHHYRLIGLDVSVTAPVSVENYGLVLLGDGSTAQNSMSLVPHDLVLDRMYIHGTATNQVRRCVALNSASSAIIDSYLTDCHETSADAQAIMGWNGPGPFKIVNNYIAGSSENIMFGGSDPAIPNLIPSDIEIRHNHITKPTSWRGLWLIKNLFETKNAQRVLVEGNLLENNWANGQTGVAVALKSVNQTNTCPWCSSQDITMRYNLIRNVGGGFSLAAAPDNNYQTNVHGRRFTILDNVVSNINTGIFLGDGDGLQLNGDITDITIAHNTVLTPTRSSIVFAGNAPTVRMSIRDNVLGGGVYPVQGTNTGFGMLTFTTFMPGGTFLDNVLVSANGSLLPAANFYPTSVAAIGIVDPTSIFNLSASSPFKGRASDGRDPGADFATISSMITGIVVP